MWYVYWNNNNNNTVAVGRLRNLNCTRAGSVSIQSRCADDCWSLSFCRCCVWRPCRRRRWCVSLTKSRFRPASRPFVRPTSGSVGPSSECRRTCVTFTAHTRNGPTRSSSRTAVRRPTSSTTGWWRPCAARTDRTRSCSNASASTSSTFDASETAWRSSHTNGRCFFSLYDYNIVLLFIITFACEAKHSSTPRYEYIYNYLYIYNL